MSAEKIFAIGNAHLDPVWLWGRSAGRSSMLNTIRASLNVLRENPDVRFTCSASALYRWCQETAPELFAELQDMVAAGQWEPVGGWEVQSDTVITSADILFRQAEYGQASFESYFGKRTEIAYSMDSFGHTSMLPAILKLHGFRYYAYGRGQDLPAIFRWRAKDGSSVVAHHFFDTYCFPETGSREVFMERLKRHWEKGERFQTFFYGVGDHGGGLTRQQVGWLHEAQTVGIPVVFGTLQDFFQTVEKSGMELPEYSGEICPPFRAVYSTNHAVKQKTAQAVRHLQKAERLGAPPELLEKPWREVLFNHFHDILPGTSVRKAYEHDVYPSLGFSDFTAQDFVDRQLGRMESGEDLSFVAEGGLQVWNPHPFTVRALVAADGYTDPNFTGSEFCSLKEKNGALHPVQILPAATSYGPCASQWGRLTAVVEVPPLSAAYYAWSRERAEEEADHSGMNRLHKILDRITLPVFYDNNGSWGFSMTPYGRPAEQAQLTEVREVSDGPVCSVLQCTYRYRNSEIRLELNSYRTFPEIGVRAHLNWNEPYTCLKFAFDLSGAPSRYFTGNAAGITERPIPSKNTTRILTEDGMRHSTRISTEEYAFLDFSGAVCDGKTSAFYAPDLYSCDFMENTMRLTLNRPSQYADFVDFPANRLEGWMDLGPMHLAFWLLPDSEHTPEQLPKRSAERLLGAEIREITGHPAEKTAFCASFPSCPDMEDSTCPVLALRPNGMLLWNPVSVEQTIKPKTKIPPYGLIWLDTETGQSASS